MLKRLFFIFWSLILVGCVETELEFSVNEGADVSICLDIMVEGEDFTKAVNDPEHIIAVSDVIKNLWVIQFDGTTDQAKVLGEPTYISDFSSFDGKISLVETLKPCVIYFIANTFEDVGVFPLNQWTTLGELKSMHRLVESQNDLMGAEDIDSHHVMFNGVARLEKLVAGQEVTVLLHRNIAKVSLTVKNSAPAMAGLEIKSLQVCSVPSVSYYITDKDWEAPYPATSIFRKINYAEVLWPETSDQETLTLYLPLNMRGKSSSTSESEKNKYAPDGSTYVLVSAVYTDKGVEYPITYTFYLGEDMINDYNICAGRHYEYMFELKGRGNADEDNRVSDWGLVDFTDKTKYGIANSYILNPIPSGTFNRHFRIPIDQIKVFWGNQGYENDLYYSLSNNPNWRCFVLASDFEITESNFKIITPAGNINSDKYFEVSVAPGTQGNVIIGIGSASDKTVSWSWHLWITDYDPYQCFEFGDAADGQYIYPVTGGSVHRYAGSYWDGNRRKYIMDRNIGSVYAETYPSDNRGLLYFQYGRKDPFFFSGDLYRYPDGSTIKYAAKSYNDEAIKGKSMRYAVLNPLVFINGVNPDGTSNNETWIMDDKYVAETNVWNDPVSSGEKSLFDPCPPGYRLPERAVWNDFRSQGTPEQPVSRPSTNTFSKNGLDINAQTPYMRGFKPYNQVKGLLYWPFDGKDVPNQVVYIPASGYKNQTTGNPSNHGNTSSEYWSFLWTEVSYSAGLAFAHASQPDVLNTSTSHRRARGLPVRCITDN